MPIPIASFTYVADGLTVTFTDTSDGVPTSWIWDFGFNEIKSSLQNPIIIFPITGPYIVYLIASNDDGASEPEIKVLNLVAVIPDQPIESPTIYQNVLSELPTGIVFDPTNFNLILRKWQLYIQPKVNVDPPISNDDVFDETKYPYLVNVLLAKLVIWELTAQAASAAMVTMSSSGGTTGGTGGVGGKGPLKKIETGPANAEWYDSSTFWSNMMKTGGVIQTMQDMICLFARRLRISLPFCVPVKGVTLFSIMRKRKCGGWV